jgi:hypothetical protein
VSGRITLGGVRDRTGLVSLCGDWIGLLGWEHHITYEMITLYLSMYACIRIEVEADGME